ncbi:MAG: alanine dehydrogenase [Candidatus Marinamargulisbacteria bacterium]|jgi:alanine dehydrogenase
MIDQNVLLINGEEVSRLCSMKECVKVVEQVFIEYAKGQARMPEKIYLDVPEYTGDFRAMPAFSQSLKTAGVKWVNSHTNNRSKNLPAVMALMILNDPETGRPLAIIDGTTLTNLRTGAAGGVAVKHLAAEEATHAAFIGAGKQAVYQALGILAVRPIEIITVMDPSADSVVAFKSALSSHFEGEIKVYSSSDDCVSGADIITTTTPSKQPILFKSCLKSGAHINAIGADAPGKQELQSDILIDSFIVVDDIKQACHSGELNLAIRNGLIEESDIDTTLPDLVVGLSKKKKRHDQISIFDSTGLAIQDLATGDFVYRAAKASGAGKGFVF